MTRHDVLGPQYKMTITLRALALRTSGLGLLSFAGTGLLCLRDRHGPPGAPSRLALWLDPPWYLVAGVSMTVNTIDAVVRGILWNQNSFELTADMSIAELRGLMRAKDEEDGDKEAGVAGVARRLSSSCQSHLPAPAATAIAALR